MDPRFLEAVEVVLRHEGGLVEHPSDPGGLTNFGFSLRSNPDLGEDGIRNLTRDAAIARYYERWWKPNRYGLIDNVDVATKTFDLAVNMGAGGGHRILQRALVWLGEPVAVDGLIGPQTAGAANRVDPERLLQMMRYKAAEYYFQLAERRKASREFLFGWLRRAYS